MTQLNEKQLRPAMLKDLVYPEVNIDTYTPKIQLDSVVVVFKVKQNYDAAYDLSSFIEKLPYNILDTEAQEIPNADGDYEVFCEFERDVYFPENLVKVIQDIQKLSNEQVFKGEYYQQEETHPVDEETITQFVRLIPAQEIKEFLEYSTSNLLVERNLKLTSKTHQHTMVFSNAIELSEQQACTMMREGWDQMADLGVMFGAQYNAVRTKYGIIVDRDGKHMLFI